MTPETLKALNESIEHWEIMAKGGIHNKEGHKPFDTYCSLCKLFNSKEHNLKNYCNGCPVFERTGHKLCIGSPYRHASYAWEDKLDIRFKELAKEEVEFLRSLLPKENEAINNSVDTQQGNDRPAESNT